VRERDSVCVSAREGDNVRERDSVCVSARAGDKVYARAHGTKR